MPINQIGLGVLASGVYFLITLYQSKEMYEKATRNVVLQRERIRDVWEQKKTTPSTVSNKELDDTIDFIKQNGATSVLLSGAGGGGIMIIYCPPVNRQKLLDALSTLPGKVFPVKFAKNGVESWIIED